MKKIICYTLLIAIAVSCSKKNSPSDTPANGADIYISGSIIYLDGSGIDHVYWKNNGPAQMAYLPLIRVSTITKDICVVNNDIYITGVLNGVACLWKNGEQTLLTTSEYSSIPEDIDFEGNDVYIAGSQHRSTTNTAGYWKNGEWIQLGRNSSYYGNQLQCRAITIDGNNVHAAGNTLTKTVYWKNGMADTLDDNITPIPTEIQVEGSDVYISGSINGYPGYWKNGEPVVVSSNLGNVTDMSIINGDIHLAGNESDTVVYWKNGVRKAIAKGDAYAMVVNGDDVYIAGNDRTVAGRAAVYWKNGLQHRLTNLDVHVVSETATGIAVVPGL